ncbi:MAG TPA: MBL fold metallo-hydrolase [Conexibacter sp.]|nr:MBL fold metallo-hydrolase [Conexibacter sp.]
MSDPVTIDPPQLPRTILPGLVWIGACTRIPYRGEMVHSYHAVYVLSGTDSTLIVDTGPPKDWAIVERHLDQVLADGCPPVRHLVPTHTESPHCGNLGRLMRKFPEAEVSGDVRDLHLFFPGYEERLRPRGVGERIDLGGGTGYEFVDAVIRDIDTSLWGYDSGSGTLFTGDGFAYAHHHGADQCGRLTEELPELKIDELSAIFAEYALYWMRFTDMRGHIQRLEQLLASRPVNVIAPGHGSPIVDPAVTTEKVKAGLLAGSDII